MVGFWVQRMGEIVQWPETQILQPMHSRMSSGRPSSIFRGRKGSAIDGRVAPIMSSTPRLTCATMVSGEVNRPTPTTGLVVTCFTNATCDSCAASGAKREVAESPDQVPTTMSHRSGNSARHSIASRPSASEVRPRGPISSSMISRTEMPSSPLVASRLISINSFVSRARFSKLPPYSSVRRLRGERNWKQMVEKLASTLMMSKPACWLRRHAAAHQP